MPPFGPRSESKMKKPYLTQAEADSLIAMEKHRQDDRESKYPDFGGKLESLSTQLTGVSSSGLMFGVEELICGKTPSRTAAEEP